jgi:hypothetical protein
MSTSDRISFAALAVSIVALVLTGIQYVGQSKLSQKNAIAKLDFVSLRSESSEAILTLQNTSPGATAAISLFRFVIDDPAILRQIEARIPKEPAWGSSNDFDEVIFSNGWWLQDGTYEFTKNVEYHVAPGKPNTFRIGIADDRLAGMSLTGTLTCDYSYDGMTVTFTHRIVTVVAKPRAFYQNRRKRVGSFG